MKLELSGVRVRLWLATALPAMLVIALLVVGFASQYGARMSEALKDRGVASARQLGSAAEFSLFAGDSETLDRLADAALRSDVQLRGVKIYSPQGQLRARAGQMRAAVPRLDGALQVVQSERSLVVAQPIYSTVSLPVDDIYAPVPDVSADMRATEARLLGYAVVEMSMQSLAQQRRDLLIWSLATAVGGLMLAGVMASVLSDLVSAQIGRINRVVQAVGEGQLGERVDMAQIGIMRPLAEGINAMVAQIATTQDELQQQIRQATKELREQKDAAEHAARTDALTGVASRRAFTDAAEAEMQRALRYRSELSMLMMDLDHFKVINDHHGHATGDAVLVSFAQTVLQLVRKVDMVARLGGEEFVVLLPNITAEQATALAERIREAVYTSRLHVEGKPVQFSVSIGVAQFDRRELSLAGWMARADAALYQAKEQGRNRVVLETLEA